MKQRTCSDQHYSISTVTHKYIELCAGTAKDKQGKYILDTGVLNVRLPTLQDIAANLPAAWKGGICKQTAENGKAHPTTAWLDKFWKMLSALGTRVEQMPTAMQKAKICRLTDRQLASPEYCSAHEILTRSQLRALPENASRVLTAAGGLCFTDPQADGMGHVSPFEDAISKALTAAAARLGLSLTELVSKQHLGSATFNSLQILLADVRPRHKHSFWQVLEQCSVFEDITGQLIPLTNSDFTTLPDANWERMLSTKSHLLPWRIVKYHTGASVQRRLLNHSQSSAVDRAGRPHHATVFVTHELLPEVYRQKNSAHEPLLLHALDEFKANVSMLAAQPVQIFADGKLRKLSETVDPANGLLSFLFAKQHQPADYTVLSAAYAENGRLPTLKRLGLAHDDTTDPAFFLSCAKQFRQLANGHLTEQQTYLYSQKLVRMLHNNLLHYLVHDRSNHTAYALARQRVYTRALHAQGHSASADNASILVSLAESEDYKFHRLVSTASPLTDPAMGDTTGIRTQLGLPTGPAPVNVIKHLLNIAQVRNMDLASNSASKTVPSHVQEDVSAAYTIILNTVSDLLRSAGDQQELKNMTAMLLESPWVLVQSSKFVLPELLFFDLDEESADGELACNAYRANCTVCHQADMLCMHLPAEQLGLYCGLCHCLLLSCVVLLAGWPVMQYTSCCYVHPTRCIAVIAFDHSKW